MKYLPGFNEKNISLFNERRDAYVEILEKRRKTQNRTG
jgi:hypothetical protein